MFQVLFIYRLAKAKLQVVLVALIHVYFYPDVSFVPKSDKSDPRKMQLILICIAVKQCAFPFTQIVYNGQNCIGIARTDNGSRDTGLQPKKLISILQ
jgi:hypothetical protein